MLCDAPDHAIAIWLEGDIVHVRLGDQQEITVPDIDFRTLLTILRHRASAHARGQRSTVGMPGAPVQYDIDRRDRDLREARKARERFVDLTEVDELLAAAGL